MPCLLSFIHHSALLETKFLAQKAFPVPSPLIIFKVHQNHPELWAAADEFTWLAFTSFASLEVAAVPDDPLYLSFCNMTIEIYEVGNIRKK